MRIGDLYIWKTDRGTPLIYKGTHGRLHQFAKPDMPNNIWCQVIEQDMHMLQRLPDKTAEPVLTIRQIQTIEDLVQGLALHGFARESAWLADHLDDTRQARQRVDNPPEPLTFGGKL